MSIFERRWIRSEFEVAAEALAEKMIVNKAAVKWTRFLNPRAVLTLTLACNLAVGDLAIEAATPTIGTVVSNGSFRVDSMTVQGNSTLFEGATVETGVSSSSMHLASGARMTLSAESKGRIFGDHFILEHGQGQLDRPDGFRVEARGLTIQPETGNATGRVQLAGVNRVQVSAVTGSFRILNSGGLLVARLFPGTALAFEPQGIPTLTRASGRLEIKAGHYLLTDETTRVTMEVVGKDIAKAAGHRVEIRGSMDPAAVPVSDASQLVRVQQLRLLAQAAPPAPAPAGEATGTASSTGGGASGSTTSGTGAAGGSAGGTAPAATTTGATTAGGSVFGIGITTIAIIGGVATAAAVGGLAASGAIGGGSPSISR